MGSLADKCQEEGRLAASFFFSSPSKSSHAGTKHRFVLTLVYQIQQHASLKGHLGQEVASTIVEDPSILGKHLKEQMEVLLLRPLRDCRGRYDVSVFPKIIIIDGLDECEANQDQGSSHDEHQGPQLTRQRDQEEILSCLLQAATDPAFPFKIIIASRPERTIRNFLLNGPIADPSLISHRFLGDKWDPSKDIDRFLLSQFRQIRREYPHLRSPVHWPGEAIIARLVKAASGQFAYAQTVIRFVRTPSKPPQVQLEYVLGTRCDPGVAPLEYLDALYIKILNSTPNPALTFQWLLAYRWFQRKTGGRTPRESATAWFFARFCETMGGEADFVFGDLAALVRIPDHSDVDSQYDFYHKDFLNFLDDPRRSRAFRSHTGGGDVTQKWIVNRFVRSLICKGPEVPTADPAHLPKFMSQFFKLWNRIVADKEVSALLCQEEVLCRCDAAWWVGHESNLYLYNPTTSRGFWREMCALVHRKCRTYAPCAPACKLWRDAIVHAGKLDGLQTTNTTTNNDRFFVKLKRWSNMSSLSLRSPGPP
ncbi:hypothetical protein FA13DRAFT_1812030 [Coprinellus micaceus]|uniref:Nephrocystin 3-like N-terminal domain-containing protein n=1 Tax=Coprinellus micaceus TaxID=71717 RepID=A0A4Y7TKE4_COPMI|nr:hypothetical protein FA13DRAFT_1812030 [Coprinellus micaceus]